MPQIIAQKFLHDGIYTLTTWTETCCKPRYDITNKGLHLTERLILEHIRWSVSKIANERVIKRLYKRVMSQDRLELRRKYPQLYYGDSNDNEMGTTDYQQG